MPRPARRWFGVGLGLLAGSFAAPTFGGNTRSKKNALLVSSATFGITGARAAVLTATGHGKKPHQFVNVAGKAAVAGLTLYQALKKDKGAAAPVAAKGK